MTTKKLTRPDRRVFMTRMSCNSFRLLLLAFIPLCASLGVARADIDQTFNFSGTLSQTINGSSSVKGQFTIDFTNDSVTAFDFNTPYGNMDGTSVAGNNFSGWGAQILEFQPTNPGPTFTELAFKYYAGSSPLLNHPIMDLLFESPLSAFSGSSFYPQGQEGDSVLDCLQCSTIMSITFFSSGSATPVLSAVPEPRSALLLIGVLLFTVCVIRRKAKPVGSH